jgi:nucleotide-binding universal stress UspA family protein
MHRFRNLMVALPCTAVDSGLVRYAAMICRWGTVQSVRFLHVLPGPGDRRAADAVESAGALSALNDTVRVQFGAVPGVQITCDVQDGPLTDRLLAEAAEHQVDLLLVGRHQDGSRRSLARRLAMKSPCSVWIVPETAPAAVRRILVPVDFSATAGDALRVAIAMSRLSGAECLALHVYFNRAVTTYEGYDQVLRGQEEQAWQQFIAAIDCQGVAVTPLFEESANPAHAILRVADREGADLIVMSTRGRSRSAAILLGSVTEETIIESRLPLLAVKHFGARMGVLEALLDRRFLRAPGLHTD